MTMVSKILPMTFRVIGNIINDCHFGGNDDNDYNFDGNDFKDFTNDLSSAIVHNGFKIVSIGLHHAEQY